MSASNKHIYLTEEQVSKIKQKIKTARGDLSSLFIVDGKNALNAISNNQYLNESRFQDWEEEIINKVQQNSFIKLYHNTKADNLEMILIDNELSPNMKHKEGHGNMLFFTVNEDAWGSETKISIEVPVKEFENRIFRFVNTDSVVTEYAIPIENYNFKIEDFKGLSYDRIMEIFDGNDSELISYVLNNLMGDYASVREWFLNKDNYEVLDKDW